MAIEILTTVFTTLNDWLVAPFTDYPFMRRALAACIALAIGGAPLGIFMAMRRMTLVGDAMSHAIIPGVAAAFLIFGMSLWPMTIFGMVTGIIVAMAALTLVRFTVLREDAAFTLLYLPSIALGVTLISLRGNSADLTHLLFGNVLAIDNDALIFIAAIAGISGVVVAGFYRRFVIECFDPDFLAASSRFGKWTGHIFFALLMANLVAAFQVLGTLMALGMTILPAIAARFWTQKLDVLIPLAIFVALASSFLGLLLSYHFSLPAGTTVVMLAGIAGMLSAIFGRYGSLIAYCFNKGAASR